MKDINSYVVGTVLIMCLCIGYVIKHLIPTDKVNRFIPVTVGAVGILVSLWDAGWAVTPDTVLIGMVSGLASTGMHEAFSQFLSGRG